MLIQHIFTTPISINKWEQDTAVLEQFKQHVLSTRSIYLDLFTQAIPGTEQIVSWTLDLSAEYASHAGLKGYYVVLQDMWVAVMKGLNTYKPLHHHNGTWGVGTMYFIDGMGDIMLVDPRGAHPFENKSRLDINGSPHTSCLDYYYTPQKYHAILFPAYLKHMVLPDSCSDRERVAISWNITVTNDVRRIEAFKIPKFRYKLVE